MDIMTVRAYWLDEEKTVVQYDFEGSWTWEEFYPAFEEALAMETSVKHRVDVICDFRKVEGLPPSALTHLKNITDKQPENIGLSIFVTTNRFFNLMYETALKFYPKTKRYFVIVATPEDAHALIQKDRVQSSQE